VYQRNVCTSENLALLCCIALQFLMCPELLTASLCFSDPSSVLVNCLPEFYRLYDVCS